MLPKRLTLATLVLIAGAAQLTATSHPIGDAEFEIVFPDTPKPSSKRMPFEGVGTVDAQTLFLRRDDASFGLTRWDYPAPRQDPDRLLDQVRDMSVKPAGGPLDFVGETSMKLATHPGREYRWSKTGTITMIMRSYLVRSRMYLLVVVSNDETAIEHNEAARAFFASFKAKERQR